MYDDDGWTCEDFGIAPEPDRRTTELAAELADLVDLGDMDLSWQADAACLDEDPCSMAAEVYAPAEWDRLVAQCSSCPVAAECRALAQAQSPAGQNEKGRSAFGIHAGEWWGLPMPRFWRTCDRDGCTELTVATWCSDACRSAGGRRARLDRARLA